MTILSFFPIWIRNLGIEPKQLPSPVGVPVLDFPRSEVELQPVSGQEFTLGDELDLVIGQYFLVEGQAQFDPSFHHRGHRGNAR